jgi:hypothetical protein
MIGVVAEIRCLDRFLDFLTRSSVGVQISTANSKSEHYCSLSTVRDRPAPANLLDA